jgi:hypothetical protein
MIENVFLDIKNKLRVIAVDVGVEEDARPRADGVITWSGRVGDAGRCQHLVPKQARLCCRSS